MEHSLRNTRSKSVETISYGYEPEPIYHAEAVSALGQVAGSNTISAPALAREASRVQQARETWERTRQTAVRLAASSEFESPLDFLKTLSGEANVSLAVAKRIYGEYGGQFDRSTRTIDIR